MSDFKLQRVVRQSTSPTTTNRINLESENLPDKGRRYLLKRIKAPDLPLIKVRNLLSPRSHHRAINSIRLNRKVTEGLRIISQTNSKVTEGHRTSSRTSNKVIEGHQMISRSLVNEVIESPLLNNRQKRGLNVIDSLQTMVSYLFHHYPHRINEMKASREVNLNLRIKIKS